MTERPILFSGPMVLAILEGRKTQTRRIVKSEHAQDADAWSFDPKRGQWESGLASGAPGSFGHGEWLRCPYGVPGDRLWLREAFLYPNCVGCDVGLPELGGCICRSRAHVVYRATSDRADSKGWRPSIHMPRWASRITLEITDVRVERLQAISGEDAIAEGIDPASHRCGCEVCARTSQLCPASASSLVLEFADLWGSIHGPESWAANPWVWAISFRRVEAER